MPSKVLEAMYETFELHPDAKDELWIRIETVFPQFTKKCLLNTIQRDFISICAPRGGTSLRFVKSNVEKGMRTDGKS